jgi:hypothetical protein
MASSCCANWCTHHRPSRWIFVGSNGMPFNLQSLLMPS